MSGLFPEIKEEEEAILGHMLVYCDSEDLVEIVELLEPEDFYDWKNQIVFRTIKDAVRKGERPDVVNIGEGLRKYNDTQKNEYEQVKIYDLVQLVNNTFTVHPVRGAHKVKDASTLRQAIAFFSNSMNEAKEFPEDVTKWLASREGKFIEMLDQLRDDRPTDIKGIAKETDQTIKLNKEMGRLGYGTGFKNLDDAVGGLIPTHTWVVGAFTGTGKTFWAIQVMLNVLKQGGNVAFFSTEMDRESMWLRILGNMAGLTALTLLQGNLTEEEQQAVDQAREILDTYQDQLRIYDNAYSTDEIRLKTKKQRLAMKKLDLVIVDFVQNLKGGGQSIYERMSNAAVDLQSLAKEIRATIVVMSQLSNEGAKDSEILTYKGAGELAAIADVGLWINKVKEEKNKLQVIIRKARHGISGQEGYVEIDWRQGGRMRDSLQPTEGKDPLDATDL